MQFSGKEDIDAPIERVFDVLSELEHYERSAIRRGIEVTRTAELDPVRAGLGWTARFTLRGKPRDLDLKLAEYQPPQMMRFLGQTQGLECNLTIDLVALSPARTRMAVVLNLSPKTLTGRLFVQSLKLAKSNLTKRFKLKLADFAKGTEDRLRRGA